MQDMTVSPAPDIRIIQIDILRGFAVLGIYWINILVFGLPYSSYVIPDISGIASQANIAVWAFSELFVDGTMRGLFSMLFGASAMIFLDEARLAGGGLAIVDRYYRRSLLLILFGIIHSYLLLWPYDVLYAYGLLGLFLFPLRKLSTVLLIVLGCSLFLIGDISDDELDKLDASIQEIIHGERETPDAPSVQSSIKHTPKQTRMELEQPSPDEDINIYRSGYLTIFNEQLKVVHDQHSIEMYRTYFFDIGGMMLMGMALLRLGILSGRRSKRFYIIMLLGGYSIGLLIRGVSVYLNILTDFDAVFVNKEVEFAYNLGRLPVTLGHVGLIGLFCQLPWLNWLKALLADVGRMALSNYILQTVFSLFFFYGIGLGLFGTFERYQLVFICVTVWLFQTIFSSLWLKFFRLGPLEWGWRSLTYGQSQPLRKNSVIQH
jgi:uncharacterized protein